MPSYRTKGIEQPDRESSFDVDGLPFIVLNHQLLYRLAIACSQTALSQYPAADSKAFRDQLTHYYRTTFENNIIFKKEIKRDISCVNWHIFSETMHEYFIENEVIK